MTGLIDHLYTQLVTTCNYSATAYLGTLQFTVTNTSVLSLLQSPLSVSWQRILTQELYGRGHTKEIGNRNATAISENCYQPELNTCY
jgi:hypothetical protein